MRLNGRTAVVTGAGRGLGEAIALRLADEGAAVMVNDVDIETAQRTVDQIAGRGGRALAHAGSVTDEQTVRALMEHTVTAFGALDVLVNNAGITRDNLIHKMSDDDWDMVAAVHLKGAFLCSRAAQREMVKRNWGRIVNLSSVSALGNRGQTNYSTAKAGLQGMAKTLAIELGRYGITANAVAPGFIDTEMTRATAIRLGRDPEEWKEERAREIPVRRAGVPRDIANLIAFLCSDEASFISGQVIYVAGGPKA